MDHDSTRRSASSIHRGTHAEPEFPNINQTAANAQSNSTNTTFEVGNDTNTIHDKDHIHNNSCIDTDSQNGEINSFNSITSNVLSSNESFDGSDEDLDRVVTNLHQVEMSKHISRILSVPETSEKNEFTLKNIIILLSSLSIFLTTWGFNASTGIVLNYYLTHETFPGASKSTYAIIACIQPFLGQILSPVAGILVGCIGFYWTMAIGTLFIFLGYILGYVAKNIGYLYMWAVFVGIGISLSFVPATTIIPKIFIKNRAFAISTILVGTGVGAVLSSIIGSFTDIKIFLLILAIIVITLQSASVYCLYLTFVDDSFVKQKLTFKLFWDEFKKYFSLEIYKSYIAHLIAVWFNIALVGYLIFVFTLSSYTKAIQPNISTLNVNLITVYLNLGQIVGRPLMGRIGDNFGRSNTTILFTFFCAILIWVFWLNFTDTYGKIVGFAVLMGGTCGVANVFNTVLIADCCQNYDVELNMFIKFWAFVNSNYAVILLFSEYIVQKLTRTGVKNPYRNPQIFSGCLYLFALVLSFVIREYKVRTLIDSKIKNIEKQLIYEESVYDDKEIKESKHKFELRLEKLKQINELTFKQTIKRTFLNIVV